MKKFKDVMEKMAFWTLTVIYCIAAVIVGCIKEIFIGIVCLFKNIFIGIGNQFGDAAEKSVQEYDKKFKFEEVEENQ